MEMEIELHSNHDHLHPNICIMLLILCWESDEASFTYGHINIPGIGKTNPWEPGN